MKHENTISYGFDSVSKANQFKAYLTKRGISATVSSGLANPFNVNLSSKDDDTNCYKRWYYLNYGHKAW